jgi:predicted MFS family arabinose efflux permease
VPYGTPSINEQASVMTTAGVAWAATSKSHVWLLIGSGVVAAAQIGKAVISVPLIRADLGLGLDLAGLIVGIFAILGAACGVGAGVVVQCIGPRRSLVGGMICIAIGNLIGSQAPNEWYLLVARITEGVGFLGVVLAIPTLLAVSIERERRDFVMALWSAYMPAGITLVMIVAPLVAVIGWRNLWLASACIAAVCALLLRLAVPATPMPTHSQRVRWIDDLATVICNPDCLVLAFAFFAFSCQMFSMTFALPLILTSVHGLSVGQAGLASAAMLAMATLGHVSCSLLLRSGIPIWVNVAAAFLLFGLAPFAVYTTAAPLFATMVFAALALGIGGLAPGALYAAAPQVAPHETSLPSTIGLLQQASNLGQFAGPLVIGVWVQNFGWDVVPAITVPAALFGFIAALLIRDVLSARKTEALDHRKGKEELQTKCQSRSEGARP